MKKPDSLILFVSSFYFSSGSLVEMVVVETHPAGAPRVYHRGQATLHPKHCEREKRSCQICCTCLTARRPKVVGWNSSRGNNWAMKGRVIGHGTVFSSDLFLFSSSSVLLDYLLVFGNFPLYNLLPVDYPKRGCSPGWQNTNDQLQNLHSTPVCILRVFDLHK